jgi:hypothetical protein
MKTKNGSRIARQAATTAVATMGLSLVACPPPPPKPSLANVTPELIYPGINLYDFSATDHPAYVVTVDRNRPDYEVRVLSHLADTGPISAVDAQNTDCSPVDLCARLDTVEDFPGTTTALVAAAGPIWDGDKDHDPWLGRPASTTYAQGTRYSVTRPKGPESVMVFSQNDGTGIDVAYVEDTTDERFVSTIQPPYVAVGTQTSVVKDGACMSCPEIAGVSECNSIWNIIGFSADQIVFVVSAVDEDTATNDYCYLLSLFNVQNAMVTDGGHSTNLYVGGPKSGAMRRMGQGSNEPYLSVVPREDRRVLEAVAVVPIAVKPPVPTCLPGTSPGNYCGTDPQIQNGTATYLYTCSGPGPATVQMICDYCKTAGGGMDGCETPTGDGGAPPGEAASCSLPLPDGGPIAKCGDQPGVTGGQSGALYLCAGADVPAQLLGACSAGCVHNPPATSDYCASTGP